MGEQQVVEALWQVAEDDRAVAVHLSEFGASFREHVTGVDSLIGGTATAADIEIRDSLLAAAESVDIVGRELNIAISECEKLVNAILLAEMA